MEGIDYMCADRSHRFCCASIATVKLYLGHDMAEIEVYVSLVPLN